MDRLPARRACLIGDVSRNMRISTLFSGLALLWGFAACAAVCSSVTLTYLRRRLLLTAAWVVTIAILVVVGAFIWLLRDGLGPDSIPTTGIAALGRFAHDFWIPLLIIVAVPMVCSFFGRACRIRPANQSVETTRGTQP